MNTIQILTIIITTALSLLLSWKLLHTRKLIKHNLYMSSLPPIQHILNNPLQLHTTNIATINLFNINTFYLPITLISTLSSISLPTILPYISTTQLNLILTLISYISTIAITLPLYPDWLLHWHSVQSSSYQEAYYNFLHSQLLELQSVFQNTPVFNTLSEIEQLEIKYKIVKLTNKIKSITSGPHNPL